MNFTEVVKSKRILIFTSLELLSLLSFCQNSSRKMKAGHFVVMEIIKSVVRRADLGFFGGDPALYC